MKKSQSHRIEKRLIRRKEKVILEKGIEITKDVMAGKSCRRGWGGIMATGE